MGEIQPAKKLKAWPCVFSNPNMCRWCVEPSSNWPQDSEEAKTAKEESQKREEKKGGGEAGEKAEEQ